MVPPHSEKHIRVSGLSWEVDLLADVGLVGDDVEEWVREVLGVGRSESKPHLRSNVRDAVHEFCKPNTTSISELE